MAIFRGVGGSGDSSDNSFLQEVTAQANAASASATAAANSATSALNTELTSASFNTSDGVLTLTKQDGDTVTADLDGRFLTSYTETDPVFTAHVANGITATNISNWNTAYNNHITAVDYSGSTLTLTQQDGGTLTTTINGALGSTLSHNGSTKIEAISSGVTVTGDITVSGTVDGRDLATDGTKLDGIEANATADQTDAEIKTAYENNTDTNAFTDAEKTKLTGIEANATADQTGSEIKSAYEAVADTNAFTDAEKTKLSGIEASADVTDTANVTAAGALMDSEVTNLAQVKAFDSSDYATAAQGTTADNALPKAGGQMTGNITFSGTQTVDGRDLSVDGARLDTLEKTARLRFQKRGYTNTSPFLTLTTSYQQIGQSLRLNDAVGVDCEHELELNMILNYADINSSNEGFFAVTVDAPAPASETTVNLGTVITTTSSGSSFTFKVVGNVTKHMSPYCGMSVNSDGSSAFGFNNTDGWFYDPQTNQTTVEVYAYQANKPTTGDTVYLHPFDWETSGTEIFGDTYPLEVYNANGVVNQNQFYKIYLGYHEGGRYYKIKARETTTSENLSISLMNGTYSQIIGG